jgi:hypothetical protein
MAKGGGQEKEIENHHQVCHYCDLRYRAAGLPCLSEAIGRVCQGAAVVGVFLLCGYGKLWRRNLSPDQTTPLWTALLRG